MKKYCLQNNDSKLFFTKEVSLNNDSFTPTIEIHFTTTEIILQLEELTNKIRRKMKRLI